MTKWLSPEELISNETVDQKDDTNANAEPNDSVSDEEDNREVADEKYGEESDEAARNQCVLGKNCKVPGFDITDTCDGCQRPLHGFCASPPVTDVGQKGYCPACSKKSDPISRTLLYQRHRSQGKLSRIPSRSQIESIQEELLTSKKQTGYTPYNPYMPHICPILSLAMFLAVSPLSRDSHKLFGGEKQYDRYRKIMKAFYDLNDVRDVIIDFSICPLDLGTHGSRKGACTYCTSGSVSGPGSVPVHIRAGWTLPGVQGTYYKYVFFT